MLASGYLHADETTIKVMDSDTKGATRQGYYLVYHNSIDKMVLFDYRKGRGREGPDGILKDFKGYLQTEGYIAYEAFEKRGVTVLNCMAHTCRKFYEALQSDTARAEYALDLFCMLYKTERKIKDGQLNATDALQLRHEQAVPV